MKTLGRVLCILVLFVFLYTSTTPARAATPCDDKMRTWANLVDRLFTNKPPWAQIYPGVLGTGHHIQIILAAAESSELASLQEALRMMGFREGPTNTELGVKSWYSDTTWKNPCPPPGGGSPAGQPATNRPPGDRGGWYALFLALLAIGLGAFLLPKLRRPQPA